MAFDVQAFPALAHPVAWGAVTGSFALLDPPADLALVSNVNVLPQVADRWLVLRLADGSLEIPGGTCEPGETPLATARRELLEEAGARLLRWQPFGAWHCHSTAPAPYRPHLPHPHFLRLVAWGAVELLGPPENPPDGEAVAAVLLLELPAAIAALRAAGRPELAELYALAARYAAPQP